MVLDMYMQLGLPVDAATQAAQIDIEKVGGEFRAETYPDQSSLQLVFVLHCALYASVVVCQCYLYYTSAHLLSCVAIVCCVSQAKARPAHAQPHILAIYRTNQQHVRALKLLRS